MSARAFRHQSTGRLGERAVISTTVWRLYMYLATKAIHFKRFWQVTTTLEIKLETWLLKTLFFHVFIEKVPSNPGHHIFCYTNRLYRWSCFNTLQLRDNTTRLFYRMISPPGVVHWEDSTIHWKPFQPNSQLITFGGSRDSSPKKGEKTFVPTWLLIEHLAEPKHRGEGLLF